MKTFDTDVQDKLRELTELYIIVDDVVKYSEEIDHKKNFELERNYDSEYVEINFNKAFGHVYRAGYDTKY